MNKSIVIKALHLTFLGILLSFIYFYFSVYQPLKVHRICADFSSSEVLKSNAEDAYGLYKSLYSKCNFQENITLLTLFKVK